ncbi:hypothetical protein PIB30_050845 [Stylosanthes scabra]|uniref:Uncharacterized protein n=1 Tax=Stylosanthes scabra TaxID=79078 RepID=A0ABU6YGJ7_9FABA|nr:hypothetical protein [Stylosanthes scabra]
METKISPRETDETAGDVETRISTEKNYEGREHVAQYTTKVRNSKIIAESEKTEVKNGNRTPKNLGKGPTRCATSYAGQFWVGMICGSWVRILGRGHGLGLHGSTPTRTGPFDCWINLTATVQSGLEMKMMNTATSGGAWKSIQCPIETWFVALES